MKVYLNDLDLLERPPLQDFLMRGRDFILKYKLLLFVLIPALLIVGNIFQPASFLLVAVIAIYLHSKGKHSMIILLFLFMVHFGEIRHNEFPLFRFSANAKVILSVVIGILTIYDFLAGRYYINKIFLYMIPFGIICMIGLFNSPIVSSSASKSFSFILTYFNVLHYVWNYTLKDKDFKRDFFYYLVLLIIISFILMVLVPRQAFFGAEGNRFRGAFGNPNGLGLFSMLTIIFSIYYFRYYDIKGTWLKAAIFLLPAFCLLYSGNKGNIFATLVFLTVFVLLDRKTMYWGLLFGSVALLFSPLASINVLVKVVDFFNLNDKLRIQSIYTGSGRYDAWNWAISLWEKEPWFGKGFAFEEWIFKTQLPWEVYISGHQGGVHNSYLIFMLNNGLLGLAAILIFFFRFFFSIRPLKYAFAISASFFASIFVEGWASGSLNYFTVVFLFLVTLLINSNYEKT